VLVERPALERRVIASVDAGRIPVVLGGCGTGRTSLLLRVEKLTGAERSQYLDFAAATTPERTFTAVAAAARIRPDSLAAPATPRAAFDALLAYFDASSSGGGSATFLIDDVLDIRTFESFPGLRHVQRELVSRLAASPTRFVLASRFTARAHRLLRDAPARFEVVHVPALDETEVLALAEHLAGRPRDWTSDTAGAVAALAAGRAGYVMLLLDALGSIGPAIDPVAALASLLAPDGRLTARCRESYEFRLQRARGYGALKAILGVLAEEEPLNLTEISHQLRRTPGSTKDYLSWLEDVDLVTSRGKRYAFEDPLLRVYVRLYGRPVPPTDDEIVREVGQYASNRLPMPKPRPVPVAMPAGEVPAENGRPSGIIEID
jgi:hypothetical protein